jgi:hypothetical protein
MVDFAPPDAVHPQAAGIIVDGGCLINRGTLTLTARIGTAMQRGPEVSFRPSFHLTMKR